MPEYDLKLTITVTADSKTHAMEIVRKELGHVVDVELSASAESDLFAELGVAYD